MAELYREHRPQTFKDVVGQTSTLKLLRNYLANDTFPHALLLTGPSGVGKTTIGRILASELGCHPDEYRELNTADFRGIDMVREIRENINYGPLKGKVKVWLIDESHALTKAAQEAFLKLLEDPPSYVYFMLATTDPGKLLPTVKTRCSAVPLSALTNATMTKFLTKFTADHLPDFELSEDATALLTAKALGSPRRALVLLEGLATQDIGEQKKYLESIQEEETQSIELCRALIRGAKWKEVAEILKGLKEEDPEGIRHHVLGYARAILLGSGPDACKAFCVIDSFRDNFYDSKHAGLAASCWEIVNGGEK